MREVKLPFKVRKEVLACGADLKGGFCFARGDRAYLSNGFGDLSQADNFEKYQKEIKRAQRAYKLSPKIIACDLHPGYFSTRFAQDCAIRNTQYAIRSIQHHHAHIASCMVDNGIKGKVIGVSFDGTGFGTDGNIWGGEILLAGYKKFDRLFHLDYVPMPGGEIAIKEPWRMSLSYLYKTYKDNFKNIGIPFLEKIDKQKCNVITHMIKNGINSPPTSSMGRLFDGVSSLIGIKDVARFEAEAAIELEKRADAECSKSYKGITIEEIIRGIVGDLKKKEKTSIISAKFHNTIAQLVKKVALRVKVREGAEKIVFSGGVFQNKYLVTRLNELFKDTGHEIYFHNNHSTTDSSIALGQVAVCA